MMGVSPIPSYGVFSAMPPICAQGGTASEESRFFFSDFEDASVAVGAASEASENHFL